MDNLNYRQSKLTPPEKPPLDGRRFMPLIRLVKVLFAPFYWVLFCIYLVWGFVFVVPGVFIDISIGYLISGDIKHFWIQDPSCKFEWREPVAYHFYSKSLSFLENYWDWFEPKKENEK